MAFEKPTNPAGSKMRYRNGVSISVIKLGGNSTVSRIVLRPDVIEAASLQGVQRLEVLVGTGSDEGRILLRAGDPSVGNKIVRNGEQFIIMTTVVPGRKEKFGSTSCQWVARKDGVVVTLPPEHGGPMANVTSIKSKPAA